MHCGLQIVMLTVELTHSYMHICCTPQGWRTLPGRQLQSAFIDAHRIAQTALCNPDIRLGDAAPDHVRDVSNPL
jgi:hypothetical protein